MRYKKVPRRLIEETRKIIRLYQFLRYDCGLKFADKLSAKDSKRLFLSYKLNNLEKTSIMCNNKK